MKILPILLLMPFLCHAQWYKITKQDALLMTAETIAGFADGTNQAIAYHKLGRYNQFWGMDLSWKNKYKNYDAGDYRSRFFLSKTLLVGLTDGYHLTRTIEKTANLFSISYQFHELSEYDKQDRWKVILKRALLSSLMNRLAFTIAYDHLFKIKR